MSPVGGASADGACRRRDVAQCRLQEPPLGLTVSGAGRPTRTAATRPPVRSGCGGLPTGPCYLRTPRCRRRRRRASPCGCRGYSRAFLACSGPRPCFGRPCGVGSGRRDGAQPVRAWRMDALHCRVVVFCVWSLLRPSARRREAELAPRSAGASAIAGQAMRLTRPTRRLTASDTGNAPARTSGCGEPCDIELALIDYQCYRSSITSICRRPACHVVHLPGCARVARHHLRSLGSFNRVHGTRPRVSRSGPVPTRRLLALRRLHHRPHAGVSRRPWPLPDGISAGDWLDVDVTIQVSTTSQMLRKSAQDLGPAVVIVWALWLLAGSPDCGHTAIRLAAKTPDAFRSLAVLLIAGGFALNMLNYAVLNAFMTQAPEYPSIDLAAGPFTPLPAGMLLGGLSPSRWPPFSPTAHGCARTSKGWSDARRWTRHRRSSGRDAPRQG